MKKIILAVLLLIPIIVILVINVSGLIISSAVALDVENIILTHEGIPFVSKELNLEDYQSRTFNIGVDVFPKVAINRDMVWTSSDTEVATVVDGRVTLKNYGSVDITAMSINNNNAKATCTIYISGRTLRDMRILTYGKYDEGDIGIKKYESLQLEGLVTPVAALGNNRIMWSSDNQDIVTVDSNGVIYGKNIGSTIITAAATNDLGTVNHSITITVAGESVVKQKAIYVESGAYNLKDNITSSNYSVSVDGGEIVGDTVTTDYVATITVIADGETAVFTVEKVLTEKIIIDNYSALIEGMWSNGNFIATNSSNIILKASTALGSSKSIEWLSSNSDIVNVINGRLYASNLSGEVEIIARAEGCVDATINVTVLTPVTYFRLDQNALNDSVGLMQSKVIGSMSMIDGEVINSFKLGIASVYPSNAAAMFEFRSSDNTLATVDNEGNIVFSQAAYNQPVTITATPVFSTLSAIASYTFNVIEAVNLGMGITNIYDEETNHLPDFTPYEDLHYLFDNTNYAVILHTDIYMPSEADGGKPFRNITNSIYGNGYKIDAQLYSDSPKSRIFYWHLGEGETSLSANADITFENVNIQAYKPVSDDSKEAFTSLVEKGGGPIAVEGARVEGQTFNINFRFCLFQYAYSHLDFTAGDIYVEGCIFRNNSATAITIQFCEHDAANIVVKNSIFSNAIAPIGVILGELDKVIAMKKNYTLKHSTFTFEGENYVYNWKKVDEIRMDMLPSVPDNPTFNALVYQFNNILSDFLRTVFTLNVNSDVMYYYEGSNYVNLGFLALGFWYDINPQINPESYTDEGLNIHMDEDKYWLKQMDIRGMPIVQNPLLRSVGIKPDNHAYILNQRYKDGSYNTVPDETYFIDATTYARLRGN